MNNMFSEEKYISEINDQDTMMITIIGTVIKNQELSFTLDDGTSQITICHNEKFKIGELLRIIGKPVYNTNKFKAIIIQIIDNFDIVSYKKLKRWEKYV